MAGMDERQKAFENKFQHDQELQFKVNARRAKLMGMWAAEQLGLTGLDAEIYAKTLVVADLEEAGHADMIRKLKADFTNKGIEISEHRFEKKLEEFLAIAKQQLSEGR